MRRTNCPVCASRLFACRQTWRFMCDKCGYEGSDLEPTINAPGAHALIDEQAREIGLKKLRMHNFSTLVEVIGELRPAGGKLLDVGAAHGWFLEAAQERFEVLGVEPDLAVYESTARRGLPVRNGFFPDVMEMSEKVDVIAFNDVIEHILDIDRILSACREHLTDNGLLLINLPSSDGIFYKVAKFLSVMGITSFLGRLWQMDLPSPHVHYFDLGNLETILKKHAFVSRRSGQLPTLRLAGLWTRISYTGNYSVAKRGFLFLIIATAIPFLKLLPSDIIYVVAERS